MSAKKQAKAAVQQVKDKVSELNDRLDALIKRNAHPGQS